MLYASDCLSHYSRPFDDIIDNPGMTEIDNPGMIMTDNPGMMNSVDFSDPDQAATALQAMMATMMMIMRRRWMVIIIQS